MKEIEKRFLMIRDRANCLNESIDTFFVEIGKTPKKAMGFCWGRFEKDGTMISPPCPIRKECLEYAMEVDYYLQGVWGGTTRRTREAMKSRIHHGEPCEDIEHQYDPQWAK